MKYENEITVEVICTKEELKDVLEEKGFSLKEEYEIEDVYMINKDYILTDNYLDALKHCILVRNIIEEKETKKTITYKYKEYNELGDIVKQGKIDCRIEDINTAIELLKAMNYKELIHINDKLSVYANDKTEFVVQEVNNKHIYIELEDKCNYIDRNYHDTSEMITDLNSYSLPIDNTNYFVKKAEIELREKNNKI